MGCRCRLQRQYENEIPVTPRSVATHAEVHSFCVPWLARRGGMAAGAKSSAGGGAGTGSGLRTWAWRGAATTIIDVSAAMVAAAGMTSRRIESRVLIAGLRPPAARQNQT